MIFKLLRKKCPNTELFLVLIFLYSVQIRTRNNSLFGHFSRTEPLTSLDFKFGFVNIFQIMKISFQKCVNRIFVEVCNLENLHHLILYYVWKHLLQTLQSNILLYVWIAMPHYNWLHCWSFLMLGGFLHDIWCKRPCPEFRHFSSWNK